MLLCWIQKTQGVEQMRNFVSTLLGTILIMVTQIVLIRNDSSIIDLSLDLNNKVVLGVLSVILSKAM